jgi:hypothetical protein
MASLAAPKSIFDRQLALKPRSEVSLSAFAFMFSEMVQYVQDRSQSVDDMQRGLERQGRRVGHKVLELQCWRERQGKGDGKRYNRLIELLTFISSTVWKSLFGKAADSLEKGSQSENEYMIIEELPVTNTFVSDGSCPGNLNVASYIAGILAGILESAAFPATVTAVASGGSEEGGKESTVFLINFSDEVMKREARLA